MASFGEPGTWIGVFEVHGWDRSGSGQWLCEISWFLDLFQAKYCPIGGWSDLPMPLPNLLNSLSVTDQSRRRGQQGPNSLDQPKLRFPAYVVYVGISGPMVQLADVIQRLNWVAQKNAIPGCDATVV